MPLGVQTRVGPRNHAVGGGPDPPPTGRGTPEGFHSAANTCWPLLWPADVNCILPSVNRLPVDFSHTSPFQLSWVHAILTAETGMSHGHENVRSLNACNTGNKHSANISARLDSDQNYWGYVCQKIWPTLSVNQPVQILPDTPKFPLGESAGWEPCYRPWNITEEQFQRVSSRQSLIGQHGSHTQGESSAARRRRD